MKASASWGEVRGQLSVSGPEHTQGLQPKSGPGKHTHNGCTKRLEGMCPACIKVGGIEPLEESHMVEALCLWDKVGEASISLFL